MISLREGQRLERQHAYDKDRFNLPNDHPFYLTATERACFEKGGRYAECCEETGGWNVHYVRPSAAAASKDY